MKLKNQVVSNPEGQALPSGLTAVEFGKAMSQLDLTNIPEEKRVAAVMDHYFIIFADNVDDKEIALRVRAARQLKNHRRG